MKSRHLSAYMLAVLLALPLVGSSAVAATIQVLETFDYPGTGNLTRPQKINDNGDIVGSFVDSSGVARGFFRSRNGDFSAPLVEPNDTGNSTQGRGINNSLTICGDYLISAGSYHGYFLSGDTYSEFDVADALDTSVLGVNNAGDFAGNFIPGEGPSLAFVSLSGIVTSFGVPEAIGNVAYQLNASNQSVGYYVDSAAVLHGFLRKGNGTLLFPIDPAGSTGTILFGLNDQNWVVGRYSDSAGVTHGLFFFAPGHFTTFDFPGSTYTSLNGINRRGFICGRYLDAAGIEHGFVARVVPGRTGVSDRGAKTKRERLSPAKSAKPSPSGLQFGAPAS